MLHNIQTIYTLYSRVHSVQPEQPVFPVTDSTDINICYRRKILWHQFTSYIKAHNTKSGDFEDAHIHKT